MPRLKISHDTWSCAWPQSSLQECYCYWVTVLSFSSGNGVESCQQQTVIIGLLKGKLHSAHTHQKTHTHVVKQSSQPQPFIFTRRPGKCTYCFSYQSFFLSCCFFLIPSVCSSAPVGMKIQPLNQTALMVSWERPLTIYNPPITSYMVSYSWVKRDVADEKTFTKTGDQSMVSTFISYSYTISALCHDNLDLFLSSKFMGF